jgi:glutamate synthase domain-containing protein 3
MALSRLAESFPELYGSEAASIAVGVCRTSADVNAAIVEAAADAVQTGREAELHFRLRNSDRSVGATLAGLIARTHGREGMPPGSTIRVRCEGEAGQSFGAWCMHGMELVLDGRAQDGVGKGMSGGLVCVAPRSGRSTEPPSVAGNNVGYGATGGTIFIAGRAGHRLGIRNSGATIVAEAAGKYACEYMTAGRAVVLGPIENEIGSGMTSGELIVLDVAGRLPCQLHARSVTAVDCKYVDFVWLHPLIEEFHRRTGSRMARWTLEHWAELRRSRRWKKVAPLAVARKAEDFTPAGSHAG